MSTHNEGLRLILINLLLIWHGPATGLLEMDGGEESKKKKSLPPKVTTPKRGPLLLVSPGATQTKHSLKDKRHCERLIGRPEARQGYLTHYPVHKLPPKPMDVIEGHLERGLTWSELGHDLQLLQVSCLPVMERREETAAHHKLLLCLCVEVNGIHGVGLADCNLS